MPNDYEDLKNQFYYWLEKQYGRFRAYIIKKQYERLYPWEEGENPYWDYWMRTTFPTPETTAGVAAPTWLPEGATMYPEVPPEYVEGKPWITIGETEEEYYEKRPWLKLGVSEQAFRRKQWGFPTKEEIKLQQQQLRLQQEELGRQWAWRRQQMQQEQWRTMQDVRAAQANLLAQRFAAMTRTGEDVEAGELETKARAFEEWRQRLLGELDPDRDWIKIEELERKPNPYVQPPTEETELDIARQRFHTAERALGMLGQTQEGWWAPARENILETARTYAQRAKELKEAQEAQQYTAKALDYIANPEKYEDLSLKERQSLTAVGLEAAGMPPEPAKPTTPPAPKWLPRFVPSQKAGEPVTKAKRLITPSLQAWGRLPYTQRQKMAGYVEWSGQSYRDMLERMAMMRPVTPRVAPRWAPAIQRA